MILHCLLHVLLHVVFMLCLKLFHIFCHARFYVPSSSASCSLAPFLLHTLVETNSDSPSCLTHVPFPCSPMSCFTLSFVFSEILCHARFNCRVHPCFLSLCFIFFFTFHENTGPCALSSPGAHTRPRTSQKLHNTSYHGAEKACSNWRNLERTRISTSKNPNIENFKRNLSVLLGWLAFKNKITFMCGVLRTSCERKSAQICQTLRYAGSG